MRQSYVLPVLFLLHFLRLVVLAEAGAIAAVVFAGEEETAFQAGGGEGGNEEEGEETLEKPHV
jgi:hypothetical protein